jgi:flagellar biosynthesis component FlhA
MGKRGRKDKYFSHIEPYLKKIPKMYETMTEAQIARKLGVSVASWEKYKNEHEELVEALKYSKENLVEELKSALKQRALGYEYVETVKQVHEEDGKKTKDVKEVKKKCHADVGAIHLLLKNLDDNWRNDDKPTMELKRQQVALQERKLDAEDW